MRLREKNHDVRPAYARAGRKGAYLLIEMCGLHVSQQIAPMAVRIDRSEIGEATKKEKQ